LWWSIRFGESGGRAGCKLSERRGRTLQVMNQVRVEAKEGLTGTRDVQGGEED
jgi:hypothetical protein